nr:lipopolysaccharide transport periplasmic protein LptA [Thioclava sp. SK-1]
MVAMLRILTLALTLALPIPALAQTVAFGGIKGDSSAPVEITADQLEVNQDTGQATFTGDVLVIQGDMRLNASVLKVDYGSGDASQVQTITASGSVVLVSPSEAAESDAAVYDVPNGNLVMTGNVLLTQGQNVMSGQKLTVDMDTGKGQMDGRVRTILQPGGSK